ncbi:MAG: hypothetical protein LAP39_23230 [Acidobacteriia bacterium]|nr:hypothetical protein [Terriglobia bacterium]
MRSLLKVLSIVFYAWMAVAQQTRLSNDGASCVACHPAEARSQPHTAMAQALESTADCEILRANPQLTFRDGVYTFRIVREGDRSLYTVTDGKETLTVPIAWAFGLGSAGQTYVYERNGTWYESRVSFYKQLRGLDLTMGAQDSTLKSVEEAAGRLTSPRGAQECFACHSTNATHEGRLEVNRLTPGVQCERCHGPAGQHVRAVKTGDVKGAAMQPLGKMTTEELSDFCGQCHRTWSHVAANGPHNVNNVRFQPYRLTNSRCYDALDPRIRCVACHDPHRDVERRAASYDAKCLACHGAAKALAGGRPTKICPTGTADCVHCHMPKYEIPGSHNLFTDHQIRVARPGEPYPG